MKQIVINIFLGLVPEVLFFTLFIISVKKLKEKKVRLFFMIAIIYTACVMIIRYKIIFYFLFLFLLYGGLKILYKKKIEIIDISIFSLAMLYITIVSALSYVCIKEDESNYWYFYFLARVLLFAPFILKSKFNLAYEYYRSIWNINDKGIKSITVRNISVIVMAVLTTFINTCISIKIS